MGNRVSNHSCGSVPEAYRVLFPIGLTCAFFAVLMWPMFNFGILSFYPRSAHADLMFFGFFGAFISGFLMTAIPKMTGTPTASWFEIIFCSTAQFIQIAMAFRDNHRAQVLSFMMILLFLLQFIAVRLMKVKRIPFEGFYFIPVAFLWIFWGMYHELASENLQISASLRLSAEAFLLNLICGLGSRLIPIISRTPNAISPHEEGKGKRWFLFFNYCWILNLILLLQLFNAKIVSFAFLGFYLIVFGLHMLRLHQRPIQVGFLGLGLKVSWTIMIISQWMLVISPNQFLAIQHLFYLAGLLLLTLSIATRVMIAHSGNDLKIELKGKFVAGTIVLILVAGVLRFMSGYDVSGMNLNAAVLIFTVGIGLWAYKFFQFLRS